MDEIISYKMCAVKVRNAKLRNYLKLNSLVVKFRYDFKSSTNTAIKMKISKAQMLYVDMIKCALH